MNDNTTSGGRYPLRVYLAGSTDPEWRLSLLRPDAHEAYAVAVQLGDGDVVLPGALPYGHTMVGPFQVRPRLMPGDLLPKETYEFTRGRHLQNPERFRMRSIAKADIVFAWVPTSWGPMEPMPMDFGAELGLAYGTGKAVVLAASSQEILERTPLITEFAWKMITEKAPRDAYERIMADLDVTFERGMARIVSQYGGQCSYCRGGYKEGESIFWSKPNGGMHLDCHARFESDNQNPNAVVFNSELIHALRIENADLEKECLELMTEKSMLEQKNKALEDELGALHVGRGSSMLPQKQG